MIERLLPAEMRARYGDEIRELLEHSRRPVRDRVDLALVALGLRLGRRLAAIQLGVAGAGCVALGALTYSIRHLQGGPVEVFAHWWSTLSALSVAASSVGILLLSLTRHRLRAWRSPA